MFLFTTCKFVYQHLDVLLTPTNVYKPVHVNPLEIHNLSSTLTANNPKGNKEILTKSTPSRTKSCTLKKLYFLKYVRGIEKDANIQ